MPDETGAGVFGHDDGDAGVDADNVGGGPVGEGIEGVDKAVGGPGLCGVFVTDGLQDAEGFLR